MAKFQDRLYLSSIVLSFATLVATSDATAQTQQFLDALSGDASPSDLHDAGDVNGDGLPDYVAGFPQEADAAGVARVLDGADASLLFETWGERAGDLLGSDIRAAGDVDADGFGDVVVGAPGGGYVRIVSGFDGSVIATLEGHSASGFGTAVSGAGDLDADGFGDILVSAPLDDVGGIDTGSVWGFSVATGDVVFAIHGSASGDHLGADVDAPCDATASESGSGWGHDMDEDIIIGATQEGSGGAGYALVVSREDFSVRYRLEGDAALDGLGSVVGLAGDIDGDGVGDLVVAANPTVDGSNGAYSRIYSGATGSTLETVTR